MKALLLIIIGIIFIISAVTLIISTKNRYREKEALVPVNINNRKELDWNNGIPAKVKESPEEITKDINETSTATVGIGLPNI